MASNVRDHTATRAVLDEIDAIVKDLVGILEPPVLLSEEVGRRWVFRRESLDSLLVAKSVRMASGLHGAMSLADSGFVTESGCLLRVISDMVTEVISLSEAGLSGSMSRAQRDFLDEFFERPGPISSADANCPARRYVSRADIWKAIDRLAMGGSIDRGSFRRMKLQLDDQLDAYIHVSYATCMELYDAYAGSFELCGVKNKRVRVETRRYVALMACMVLLALGMTALSLKQGAIATRVNRALEMVCGDEESPAGRSSRSV